MKKILYLTDMKYKTSSRGFFTYGDEDKAIIQRLRSYFDITICDLPSSEKYEDSADIIVLRNIGLPIPIFDYYLGYRERVKEKGLKSFNEMTGKGDQTGKNYLIELFKKGYHVIPTADNYPDFSSLPFSEKYILKPKNGADSIGMSVIAREEILDGFTVPDNYIIQPKINFRYEVSFYFINKQFMYAMYAPDVTERWNLVEYKATDEDIEFANKFIAWNDIRYGIQRVDACRCPDGSLLLMELEDLNPFLSFQLLNEKTQTFFISEFAGALNNFIKE